MFQRKTTKHTFYCALWYFTVYYPIYKYCNNEGWIFLQIHCLEYILLSLLQEQYHTVCVPFLGKKYLYISYLYLTYITLHIHNIIYIHNKVSKHIKHHTKPSQNLVWYKDLYP